MVDNSKQPWRPISYLTLARKHLQPALDAGGNTHSFEDIILSVLKGDMQLWHAPNGSVVTQIIEHPQRREIHWFLAGGDMSQVLGFQDSVRAYARHLGCTAMVLGGRAGWQRALKDDGWQTKGIVMEATL